MEQLTFKSAARIFCSCLLASLALSSCSDQDENEQNTTTPQTGFEVSVNADIDMPAGAKPVGATRVAVAEDDADGLKTTWETDDRLTVAYMSGGTMKTAELTVASANGNSAIFHGTVETGADANAFKTSTLYAVNNTTTDKIEAAVADNKLKVSVDLSGQTGLADKVADYDLMYAEGKAEAGLRFNHQMSVLRLDFQTDASVSPGNALTDLSMIFVPSTSTDKSIFAANASFEYGAGGSTKTYSANTFFTLTNLSIPVSDAKARVYAVVPANDKLTGELSVKVQGDSKRVFRRNINLKGKSFPAQQVVARTIGLKAEELIPRIGDYLYSDGTWGPLEYYQDKYPVALVFSNYTSEADRQKGYKHGYAVALRDAAWPTPWSPDNNDYPEAENVFENVNANATAPLTMMQNLDGLTTCETLNNKYLSSYTYENYYNHNGQKAAIPLAMEYGKQWWQYAYDPIPAVPTPAGTSGWYLPSIGQWFLMFANLSGLNPNDLVMGKNAAGQIYTFSWLFRSAEEKRSYLTKFNKYFDSNNNPVLAQYYSDGRIPQTTFYVPADGQIDWYLWACDEAKSGGYACCVRLTRTEIGFTYIDKRSGETSNNGYAARSVIAF